MATRALGQSLHTAGGDTQVVTQLLSAHSSAAVRLGALDLLAPLHITDVQYEDDLVAPAALSEQVASICAAAEAYSAKHGGDFNMSIGKSAALPIGTTRYVPDESASIHNQQLQAVSLYPYLGVMLDQWLTFLAHFKQMLARGQDAFQSFFGCAQSISLPCSLQCMVIPARIEAVVMHGIEFCIAVPGAESALNRMQSDWAKTLLGAPRCRAGSWILWVIECGWLLRLNTKTL